jgi:hypothetical protein
VGDGTWISRAPSDPGGTYDDCNPGALAEDDAWDGSRELLLLLLVRAGSSAGRAAGWERVLAADGGLAALLGADDGSRELPLLWLPPSAGVDG